MRVCFRLFGSNPCRMYVTFRVVCGDVAGGDADGDEGLLLLLRRRAHWLAMADTCTPTNL